VVTLAVALVRRLAMFYQLPTQSGYRDGSGKAVLQDACGEDSGGSPLVDGAVQVQAVDLDQFVLNK